MDVREGCSCPFASVAEAVPVVVCGLLADALGEVDSCDKTEITNGLAKAVARTDADADALDDDTLDEFALGKVEDVGGVDVDNVFSEGVVREAGINEISVSEALDFLSKELFATRLSEVWLDDRSVDDMTGLAVAVTLLSLVLPACLDGIATEVRIRAGERIAAGPVGDDGAAVPILLKAWLEL
ncbi:MAG: hypothetical protein Q9181_004299 [Wetmoreana brouardii]